MIALLFFFLDFLAYAFMHQWLFKFLLCYFIITYLVIRPLDLTDKNFYASLGLVLLQDCFLHGRFGLIMLFLAPLIFFTYRFQRLFMRTALFFPIFLSFILVGENLIIESMLFAKNITLFMTITKIFINIVIGYMILLGTRGNRSFFIKVERERKVWTPNRKDAS